MGLGLILEFNCLGVVLSLFLGPSVLGSYSLQDEGGVSLTHSVHLALGRLPDHGGYSPSLQGARLRWALVTFHFLNPLS